MQCCGSYQTRSNQKFWPGCQHQCPSYTSSQHDIPSGSLLEDRSYLARWRNCLASSSLMCFANSFPTIASLFWKHRSDLYCQLLASILIRTAGRLIIVLPNHIGRSEPSASYNQGMRGTLLLRSLRQIDTSRTECLEEVRKLVQVSGLGERGCI